jgi:hypothetical protein
MKVSAARDFSSKNSCVLRKLYGRFPPTAWARPDFDPKAASPSQGSSTARSVWIDEGSSLRHRRRGFDLAAKRKATSASSKEGVAQGLLDCRVS